MIEDGTTILRATSVAGPSATPTPRPASAASPRRTAAALALVAAVGCVGPDLEAPFFSSQASETSSAAAGLAYLSEVMDEYHDRFPVYDDAGSPGNHFRVWAKIPSETAAVAIDGAWAGNPRSGATAIRCELTDTDGGNVGGFYFLNGVLSPGAEAPEPNFGTVPGAGISLPSAAALTFWARGERGGERVEFFLAGVGRNTVTGAAETPFPDSEPVITSGIITLDPFWTRYRIPVVGGDLSYLLGGFGWIATAPNNRGGAVFYLDDIEYELAPDGLTARRMEPRFLRSFTTLPRQPDPFDSDPSDDVDLVLRNTAYTYDNALALLAFLADPFTSRSLVRAQRIGDALEYATRRDRYFTDGRLRSAYAAGDIALTPGWRPNGRDSTVSIPGFSWENGLQRFEVAQGAIDTGNNAWAMIALLALLDRTEEPRYLAAARRIGEFILTLRQDAGRYRGFQAGIASPETMPIRRRHASTEHNLDVHAAFTMMHRRTGEPVWRDGAAHAAEFVDDMWDPVRGCYLTGTLDPTTRNDTPGQLPLDVQAWSILALPMPSLRPQALTCAERHHRTTHDGTLGFDFNEDRDGVWFEGTAQMAVAYAAAGRTADARETRLVLQDAQRSGSFGNGRGVVAASHDGVSTGFGSVLFRRLHVGTTAWSVFAQLGFNPFTQRTSDAGRLTP